MNAELVLQGLDPEQRAVATAVDGPVVVMAGAGTGKTRAITHRIAYACLSGAHDPRRSMALTYTSRAAGELRERLATLGVQGVQARTFHSAARSQLAYFWPTVVGGPMPDLMASKFAAVSEAAARCRLPTDKAVVRDLSGEIEWAKASLIAPADYAAELRRLEDSGNKRTLPGELDAASIAKAFSAYEEVKDRRGVIDFDDLLLVMTGILQERPDVSDKVRATYRWFTVDEYQDITAAQKRLLSLWLGDSDQVCVVGDAAQTIYTFAGAQARSLNDFIVDHPDATQVRLVRSYRCSPQIVSAANRVLGRMDQTTRGVRLQSEKPAGPAPALLGSADEQAEAAAVAAEIAKLIAQGTPPREIAVLFRINAASEPFEEALAEAGISYVVRGSERFFDRAEVKEAMVRLRGAARSDDDGGTLVEVVGSVLAAMGWVPRPPADKGAVRERWESLHAIIGLAELMPEGSGLDDFTAELARRSGLQHAPTADGVTLASLHTAKGLEWDAVFLVGMVDGTLPIFYSLEAPEKVEEERRLFYVGVTRARRNLTLSWAWARTPGSRARDRSRFVDEVFSGSEGPRESPKVQAGGPRKPKAERTRSSGLARCRVCKKGLPTGPERTLGRCRTCPGIMNEELFNALREWRREASAGKPAYTVFTDATLQAIAERLPRSEKALAEISGVGPMKLAAHGEQLLALVAAHSDS